MKKTKAQIELTEIKPFNQGVQPQIGSEATLLAKKNENSYLIQTSTKGMILTEGGKVIYQGFLPYEDAMFMDVVYIPSLYCYLIDLGSRIYRKNVDDQPPYEYLDCCWRNKAGCSFLYSDQHDKLVFFEEEALLVVLDLDTKEIIIEVDVEG